jgi:hypothetical protein
VDGFQDTWIVLGLFMARLGVPIAVTLLVAYLFRRLDRKWEQEALQRSVGAGGSVSQPSICWVDKDCGPLRRADCPASKPGVTTCWQARLYVQGQLPRGCLQCQRFVQHLPEDPLPVPGAERRLPPERPPVFRGTS